MKARNWFYLIAAAVAAAANTVAHKILDLKDSDTDDEEGDAYSEDDEG